MSTGQHRLALPPGFELAGKYRFSDVLGSGGFGITYLAEDRVLSRKVAVKELLPNDIATRVDGTTVAAKTEGEEESLAWARERFLNEGRALAACDHPNVVHVYEMIEANGTAYMVTKYEEGRSLERWLKELGRPPNEEELRGILMPLLSGLDTVHAAGFLHRDIKPDNIYLTSHGRPLLLDFGSARQAVSNRSMAMTSIVTSGYAPFEQYYEDGNQGPWSDIYAMGAVMFRAITGKKPPEATRRLKDDPCEKLAARYFGQYSPEFLKAVDKALSVNESRRPQSVGEWREMLGGDAAEAATLVRTPDRGGHKSHPQEPLAQVTAQMQDAMRARPWLAPAVGGGIVAVGVLIWLLLRSPGPAPIIHHDTPSPAPNPTAAPSATPIGIADVTPAPQPTAMPGPDDQTPAPQPTMAPNVEPTAAPTDNTAQVDTKVVGSWQTGTNKTNRIRWDIWADGHWVISGATNDSGKLTAADGHMQQYSNTTQQSLDIAYDFDDNVMTARSQNGTVEWRRINGSTVTSTPKHRTNTNTNNTNQPNGKDVGRQMLNHFLQGRGFP